MVVIVNGERRELPADATVAQMVEDLAPDRGPRGVAVAVAGEVVPRSAWGTTPLTHGAEIEVVAAIQGG